MLLLLAAIAFLVTFAVYSVICLAVLTRSHGTRAQSDMVKDLPTVSIVVPTFNEEATILEKLDSLMQLDYPANRLEIVVVDSSSDRTPSLVEDYHGKFPIRLIRETERKGLALALNTGYSSSKGEIVVKSDADAASNDREALTKLVGDFSDPRIGGVSCVYSDSYKMLTEGAYRGLLTELQSGESGLDSTLIAHGAFVGFRRELMDPLAPDSAADDTELFVKIRKKGYRCIVDDRIVFRESRPPDVRVVRHQRARRAYGIIKVMLSNIDMFLNPRYGTYGLVVFPSNFFMLAISPILIAAGGVLLFGGLLLEFGLSGLLLAGALLVTLGVILRYQRPSTIAAFIRTQEAALLGILLFFSRRPKHVWTKDR